jgi:hypothetical protein
MSELFSTGFDLYGTSQLTLIWNSAGSASIGSGSSRWATGQGASVPAASTLSKSWGTNEATSICGFAAKLANTSTLGDFFELTDGATIQLSLTVTATGQLAVYRGGSAGTQLAATSAGYLVAGIWHYFELKATINNTTGTYEVRVDGNSSPILSGSGANTRQSSNNYANAIQFVSASGSHTFDDVYLINTSGAVNNDFLGDTRIEGRVPTGVGNYAQFTPSAGANWQNVDEIPPNDDTDYNSSSTVNNKDSFAHSSLSSLSGTVRWVTHWIDGRKDDAGTRKVAPLFRISSTDYVGSDDTLSTSYQYFRQVYETSPATSTAWTVSEINASEVGYKLTV